mgnify:CR=1 FL=1
MKIEQVLHGYSEGHRLLATSVKSLSSSALRRMALLSDWNEYVSAQGDDSSYLMCYPLPDNSYYVIAKTWYADEKERPGCVWTHSLLIDEQGQSGFFDYQSLYPFFRRPKDGAYSSYETPIEVGEETQRERIGGEYETMPSLDYWLWQILDKRDPVMLTYQGNSLKSQQLVLSLMNHIPKYMLIRMSMCSGTGRLMKYEGVAFDFQLTSEIRRSIPKLNGRVVGGEKVEGWYKTIADSVIADGTDIPMLIARFSGEIGTRVEALGAVVLVFTLLDRLKEPGMDNEQKFLLSLRIMATAFPKPEQGMQFKSVILSENVTKFYFGEDAFIYQMAVTPYCGAFDYETFGYNERVASLRKGHSTEEYLGLLFDLSKADYLNDKGKELLSNALEGLTKEEVVMLLNQDWGLFKSIVTMNNQVLTGDFWIDLMPPQFISLFAIFQRNEPEGFAAWEKLYRKLLTIDTFVTDSVLSEFVNQVPEYVAIALDVWNAQKKMPINKAILNQCMKQKSRVLLWMGQQTTVNDDLRAAIKRNIMPDESVVVSMGSKVWKGFVESELMVQKDANEMVYIYVLAFNWHDYNALSYLRRALPFIYEALSVENLNYSSWKKIERFTGSVPFWRSWDNCRKVLIGVKDYCKIMNLAGAEIDNFTTNQKLNGELAELWKKG